MSGDEDEVDEKISPHFVMLLLSIFRQEIYDMQLDHMLERVLKKATQSMREKGTGMPLPSAASGM